MEILDEREVKLEKNLNGLKWMNFVEDFPKKPVDKVQDDSACFVCSAPLAFLTDAELAKHLSVCISNQERAFEQLPFSCEICGKDITNYNILRRNQHVNRCFQNSASQKSDSPPTVTTTTNSGTKTLTPNCPICMKNIQNRYVKHLKACAKKRSISVADMSYLAEQRKMDEQFSQQLLPEHSDSQVSNNVVSCLSSSKPCILHLHKPRVQNSPSLSFQTNSVATYNVAEKSKKKQKKATFSKNKEDLLTGIALSISLMNDSSPSVIEQGKWQEEKEISAFEPPIQLNPFTPDIRIQEESEEEVSSTPAFQESPLSMLYPSNILKEQYKENTWKELNSRMGEDIERLGDMKMKDYLSEMKLEIEQFQDSQRRNTESFLKAIEHVKSSYTTEAATLMKAFEFKLVELYRKYLGNLENKNSLSSESSVLSTKKEGTMTERELKSSSISVSPEEIDIDCSVTRSSKASSLLSPSKTTVVIDDQGWHFPNERK